MVNCTVQVKDRFFADAPDPDDVIGEPEPHVPHDVDVVKTGRIFLHTCSLPPLSRLLILPFFVSLL